MFFYFYYKYFRIDIIIMQYVLLVASFIHMVYEYILATYVLFCFLV